MKAVPQTPREMANALSTIFPTFVVEEPESVEFVYEPPLTHHAVMREFACFFGKEVSAFSAMQLQQAAELLACSIQHGGDLENAIDTCFLEHTRQLRVNRQLGPWLAKARAKHGT